MNCHISSAIFGCIIIISTKRYRRIIQTRQYYTLIHSQQDGYYLVYLYKIFCSDWKYNRHHYILFIEKNVWKHVKINAFINILTTSSRIFLASVFMLQWVHECIYALKCIYTLKCLNMFLNFCWTNCMQCFFFKLILGIF